MSKSLSKYLHSTFSSPLSFKIYCQLQKPPFNDEETLDSATLFIIKSLFSTHHLLLEQEQGLSTQLSSLSVSSVIRSPQ